MRLRTTAILATAALGLTVAGMASAAELPIAPIGTGSKTCAPKRGASCKGITHHRVNLAGRDLRGVKFHGANLRHADFREADLRGARFDGAKLRGADFSGAKLKGAYFGPPTTTRKGANQAQPAPSCYPNCPGADLGGANFYEADLTGANLTSTTMNSANLTSASLSNANLSNAVLYSANLTAAWVASANFSSAWLTSANLTAAFLAGANFSSANLRGANLMNAQVAVPGTSANFSGAFWANTTCPDGTVTNTGC